MKRKSNQELLAEAAALPERLTGEVIDGELHVMSRPTPAHQEVEAGLMSALKFFLFPPHELAVPDVSGLARGAHRRTRPGARTSARSATSTHGRGFRTSGSSTRARRYSRRSR